MLHPSLTINILRLVQMLWAALVAALLGGLMGVAEGLDDATVLTTLEASEGVTAFAALASLYGIVAPYHPRIGRAMVVALLDGLATLASFVLGVALATRVGIRDCGELSFVPELERVCRVAQAGAVFMWFLCVTFAVTTFLVSKRHRATSPSSRGSCDV